MWSRNAYSGHREGLPRCTAFMYGSNGHESLFLPNYFSIPLCNGMGLNLPMHLALPVPRGQLQRSRPGAVRKPRKPSHGAAAR